MKLLEVIRTPQTSDETFDAMVAWGKAMQKTTVAAKDTPGMIAFSVNLVFWRGKKHSLGGGVLHAFLTHA